MLEWLRRKAPADTSPQGIARSETAAQLRDLERQGSGVASVAHIAATALVVLFSLGSLISLSADALHTVLAGYAHGRIDLPAAISTGVSTLLVVCMDTAMLYAAATLRVLASRRATRKEQALHLLVMVFACVLESATYVYMSWLYDRPDNGAVWAITIARALAAPLFAVYLSMARSLPVGPRDIFAQAELAAGKGVLLEVTTLANDHNAPLRHKLRIYGAASSMHEHERMKLTSLIDAVSEEHPLVLTGPVSGPDGRGPGGLPAVSVEAAESEDQGDSTSWVPANGRALQVVNLRGTGRGRVPTRHSSRSRRDTGRSAEDTAAISERRRAQAAIILEQDPRIGAQRLAAALDCPKSVAGGIKREWLAERRGAKGTRDHLEQTA